LRDRDSGRDIVCDSPAFRGGDRGPDVSAERVADHLADRCRNGGGDTHRAGDACRHANGCPTAASSQAASQAPVTTVDPQSSLDPSKSDAGVAGRLTLVADTRDSRSGTHEILGVAADGSNCSYSLDGNSFTAVAWYDAAPNGMLHQMSVTVPADEMPANSGEQRSGISNGRAFADFASDTGFGTAYSGDASEDNGGSVTINVVRNGDELTFSFAGLTWDTIEFSGQMICAHVTA